MTDWQHRMASRWVRTNGKWTAWVFQGPEFSVAVAEWQEGRTPVTELFDTVDAAKEWADRMIDKLNQ